MCVCVVIHRRFCVWYLCVCVCVLFVKSLFLCRVCALNCAVPALFITHPVSQINYTAGSLSFSCVVVGLPVPDIAWLKDDQEFLESDNANISYSSSSDSVGGETVSVVTITNLTLSDVGSYRCTANNTGALGRVFVVFSLSASLIVHCEWKKKEHW